MNPSDYLTTRSPTPAPWMFQMTSQDEVDDLAALTNNKYHMVLGDSWDTHYQNEYSDLLNEQGKVDSLGMMDDNFDDDFEFDAFEDDFGGFERNRTLTRLERDRVVERLERASPAL